MAKEQKPSEPPQQRLGAVHTAYFDEINAISVDSQKRLQDIHNEYQRELAEAWPAETPQDPAAAVAAQDAYAKASQAATEKMQKAFLEHQESGVENRYGSAFENYKGTMLKVIGDVGVEALDANTLAAISQSFMQVAQTASCTAGPQPT